MGITSEVYFIAIGSPAWGAMRLQHLSIEHKAQLSALIDFVEKYSDMIPGALLLEEIS